MNAELEQSLPIFIAESRGLLQELEAGLLSMESMGADADAVNAMFRAAHTIKGSSGIFGLDAIVKFTHVVENVLDKLRDGSMSAPAELVSLLLECVDHLNALVDLVENHAPLPDTDSDARAQDLLTRLRAHLGVAAPTPEKKDTVPAPNQEADKSCGANDVDLWHLSLEFGVDVLRHGMDPLSFIRYLGRLGDVVQLVTSFDKMPAMADMDPESCYISMEIDLRSGADKAAIESAFEFVREDCTLRIVPPPSHLVRYVEHIQKLNGNVERLGDILVESGVLTRTELTGALKEQELPGRETVKQPLGEILVNQGVVPKPVVEAALDKQKQIREQKSSESRYVRVQADKLDALINLVGELVIASASTSLLAQKSGDAQLHESTNLMSRLVEEIRDGALHLRMVQIGETFNRFPRVVRDVSKELGKDIELVIGGAETELDKSVVEKISDPLMHLVRNAIDHGIEAADARVARGKPAKGTVRLNAYHESGGIVIEIGDDGGGLNREKILRKAVERGLVATGQSLTDQEVYRLIFEPGFSTAEQVTNLSGRGVGMDVVKRNITALRGNVDLESEEGLGTTVRIRLPLTLAIIDGFLVRVGKSAFVAPLDMVEECVELSGEDLASLRDRHYLNLRGEVLPFIYLRGLFGIGGKAGRRERIVVVQCAGRKAGIVVDELLGECQTVIKPLSKLFAHIKGIGGSTILGSGEVALILDIQTLMQHAIAVEGAVIERVEAAL